MNARETLTEADEQTRRRSDPRRRRRALRALDLLLADEMREAGAVSLDELVELADRPFGGRASRETIAEWWEYACRRGWLEEHAAGRSRVSGLGREELHEQRQRASQPDPLVGAKAVTKWVLAVGVVGAAGLLSNKHLTTELAILIICATIVLAPAHRGVAYEISRSANGSLDRSLCVRLAGGSPRRMADTDGSRGRREGCSAL